MDIITQSSLAAYEKAELPVVEKSNFLYSFSFLPKEEREAINSLYAFCSYIDSIVDDTPNDLNSKSRKLKRLDWWEKEIEFIYSGVEKAKNLQPFYKLIDRFVIPKQYFTTLISGCRRDLLQNRYDTFEDLKTYCYSVASVVGLMSIEIFGYKYEETKSYAINLGYALQLTNILRDIQGDAKRNFIYIPEEDLERFGYSEKQLLGSEYNAEFAKMMRFQVARSREYYHKARSFLRSDERGRLLPAQIMDDIYYRLLEKIELNEYNVLNGKIRVSNIHKVMIAMKHWLNIQLFVSTIRKS
ncbi:MAG: presqualene diphosphate synthase HpnD [Candidatus Kapaibacteriales bacterium]